MNEKQTGLMLVGVGGGGVGIAAAAAAAFGAGMQAVGFDTDAMTSRQLPGGLMRCLLIGVPRCDGRATGGDMVKGRTAAQDDVEAIKNALAGTRTAVVVATLGGGVGGGATPEILRALRELGAHTLCFAALPFELEGPERRAAAMRALPLIEENADALVVVPLDDLFADAGGYALADAIPRAEAMLAAGLTLFWRLVLTPGFIPLDVETIHALLRQSGGRCRFAVASAEGAGRGVEAVSRLSRSALLGKGTGFAGAQAVALGVLAGADLCLAELSEISKRVQAALPGGCRFHLGTMLDERFAGHVHLVALAFDAWRDAAATAPDVKSGDETTMETLMPLAGDSRPGRGRGGAGRSKLSFGATGRGRFKGVEATLLNGEDLDIPAYLRRGLTLDR
ncbi:MAG: hypothetical protein PHR35_11260 [Kiritimatiellae bacterium]|nr:hypothetical protein [Kiritimatiellia bacterium]